ELVGRSIPHPEGVAEIKESAFMGLGVSKKWHGVNLPPQYTPWAGAGAAETKGILSNPWAIGRGVRQNLGGFTQDEQLSRFVDYTLGTMIHEISHNSSVRGHGEHFSGILTRAPAFFGSRMQTALTSSVRKQLAPIWETLVDDLTNHDYLFDSVATESTVGRGGEPARPAGDLAGLVPGGAAGGPLGRGAAGPGGGPGGGGGPRAA